MDLDCFVFNINLSIFGHPLLNVCYLGQYGSIFLCCFKVPYALCFPSLWFSNNKMLSYSSLCNIINLSLVSTIPIFLFKDTITHLCFLALHCTLG
jgi:hypothetical protein